MARKTKTAALATDTEIVRDTAADTKAPAPDSPEAMPRRRRTASKATAKSATAAAPAPTKRRRKGATAEKQPETTGTILDGHGKPITGKLGTIASAVAIADGATIDELVKATGWQPHTVRAALTRLRQRGIDAKLATVDDRKAYRVATSGG